MARSTCSRPAGMRPMTRELPRDLMAAQRSRCRQEAGPFNPRPSLGYLPVAGRVEYSLDPEWIPLGRELGRDAEDLRRVRGADGVRRALADPVPRDEPRLAGERSRARRHHDGVRLADRRDPVGGHGEFDGVMLDAFTRPRIEGTFRGDRMRAWDVVWGAGRADLSIENSYVNVIERGDDVGRLGDQRRRPVLARLSRAATAARRSTRACASRAGRWRDLRHAFELDDYHVDGIVSGEYHLYGNYETPARLRPAGHRRAASPTARPSRRRPRRCGSKATASGSTPSTSRRAAAASPAPPGSAGTAPTRSTPTARRFPSSRWRASAFPARRCRACCSSTRPGAGTFDEPRYDVKVRVDDLFAGDEGIGQVTGRLSLRGELLTLDLEAASPRLVVSGSGRIALTPEMDAELTLRFRDTSLDPYVRFFEPRLSPFTTAVAGGTVRVVGELANSITSSSTRASSSSTSKLFDYRAHERRTDRAAPRSATRRYPAAAPRRRRHAAPARRPGRPAQQGHRRRGHRRRQPRHPAGLLPQPAQPGHGGAARRRSAGRRQAGVLRQRDRSPTAGSGTSRCRTRSKRSTADLSFDASGIRVDDVAARLGGGQVTFGGRIGLNGFTPGDLNLTAVGEQMRCAIPRASAR